MKEILEKRDTEIANPKNTDKKAINYEFIIKQYFDEALKKIGGEANLKKACQNEKLNFKELVKISQSTPDKLAGVNE